MSLLEDHVAAQLDTGMSRIETWPQRRGQRRGRQEEKSKNRDNAKGFYPITFSVSKSMMLLLLLRLALCGWSCAGLPQNFNHELFICLSPGCSHWLEEKSKFKLRDARDGEKKQFLAYIRLCTAGVNPGFVLSCSHVAPIHGPYLNEYWTEKIWCWSLAYLPLRSFGRW